ncbi:MAG: metallophosphoesterase family protein [Oscillospiraceae bacterium]|nr:metallophosphoesterase family protein [Oscillospiraceae bacterium]
MRILHAADLHLNTPFTGRSEDAVKQLKKALMDVPQQITELVKTHHCDLLLLSGDLFDGHPGAESLQALKNALSQAQVPTFISPGNHDFCTPDSPWLTESWPDNVHIFTKPAIESVSLPHLDCRIYGAGFTSMDCPALMEHFRAEGPETYHIAVLHGDPLQRSAPYNPITPAQVAASGLHYLALGHLHTTGQFTAGNTLCAWPGSAMGRGYDETGARGVYLVTLEDAAQLRFIPLDNPRFYDLESEVFTSPADAVQTVLPPVGSNDFYRITLIGEAEPFTLSQLQFPAFPNLELRDRTVPPTDLWVTIEQDNLEGVFFKMLHDLDSEDALLAAKIARRILDGREVALP